MVKPRILPFSSISADFAAACRLRSFPGQSGRFRPRFGNSSPFRLIPNAMLGFLRQLPNPSRNLSDRALLRDLESSLLDEQEPEALDVQKVYRQGGVVLPELVRVRFEEVDRFHRRVLENRRAHLRAEIESANARIAEREAAQGRLDLRRQQIMGILDSGGALEEYTALREELGRADAEVESLT